jgi:hypothetical protein
MASHASTPILLTIEIFGWRTRVNSVDLNAANLMFELTCLAAVTRSGGAN